MYVPLVLHMHTGDRYVVRRGLQLWRTGASPIALTRTIDAFYPPVRSREHVTGGKSNEMLRFR
jgi:hypothetical protein